MGPFNEMRQLERAAAVRQLLARNDISEWARNYWTLVLQTLARDEDRYNARVANVYKKLTKPDFY